MSFNFHLTFEYQKVSEKLIFTIFFNSSLNLTKWFLYFCLIYSYFFILSKEIFANLKITMYI